MHVLSHAVYLVGKQILVAAFAEAQTVGQTVPPRIIPRPVAFRFGG